MSLQQFTPTTNKSVLVYNQFKGFPLESGKTYRENNINKANSILALAVQNDHNAYLFEIYEEINTQKITDSFKQIDPTFKYLKLVLDSHIQLLLFTRLNEEMATTNMFRTASGAPGPAYYQQKADYKMNLELDDKNKKLYGGVSK